MEAGRPALGGSCPAPLPKGVHHADNQFLIAAEPTNTNRACYPFRGGVMHLGNAPIAAGAVAQASRTANCPLVPALDTTWSLRDSTNSRNVVNPSDFSLKAGSIRCIWLLTPAA